MKKCLSLLLAILITLSTLFAMVSCDDQSDNNDNSQNVSPEAPENDPEKLNGQTPHQLFTATVEKIKNLTNYTMETNQTTVINYMGYSITKKESEIDKSYSTDNWYMISKDTQEGDVNSSLETYETWCVDKTIYGKSNEGGTKIKFDADEITSAIDEVGENYGFSSEDIPIFLLPDSYFKDIHFEKDDENNTYKLNFSIDGEKFTELFSLGIATVGDITYVVHFDINGELQFIEISGKMSVLYSEGTFYTVSKISDVGTTEKISAPDDADDYEWVTISDMFQD